MEQLVQPTRTVYTELKRRRLTFIVHRMFALVDWVLRGIALPKLVDV